MMTKSRGFRGHRSLYSSMPPIGGAGRIRGLCLFRKHNRTGRYNGASVWVGKKHKPIVLLHRGVLPKTHIRHNIPHMSYTRTQRTGNTHTPYTYTCTQHTHTPQVRDSRVAVGAVQVQLNQIIRVNRPSHQERRKGSTKAHTHTHHIRHTHTRHTVSEGFAFTHPDLCANKLTWGWFNKAKEPSFTGVLHTFTGVLHTTTPPLVPTDSTITGKWQKGSPGQTRSVLSATTR